MRVVGLLVASVLFVFVGIAHASSFNDLQPALRTSDLPPRFVWDQGHPSVVERNVLFPPVTCTLDGHLGANVEVFRNGIDQKFWSFRLSEAVSRYALRKSTPFAILGACGMLAPTTGSAIQLFANYVATYQDDVRGSRAHSWAVPKIGNASFGQNLNGPLFIIFRHRSVVFVITGAQDSGGANAVRQRLVSWTRNINSRLP